MEHLISPELSLDCTTSSKLFVPKIVGHFLAEVSRIQSVSGKVRMLNDYVNRLSYEFKKIEALEQELPISMFILNDAVLILNEELDRYRKLNEEPVLEEFIPLKNSTTDEGDDKIERDKQNDTMNKMNWMKSVQLWNADNQQHHNPNSVFKPTIKQDTNIINKKRTAEEIDRPNTDISFPRNVVGRAFVPFKVDKDEFPEGPGLTLEIKNPIDCSSGLSTKFISSRSSYAVNDRSNFKQSVRKQRRCWSPELHLSFVNALQKLGGVQAATPKQIRDVMNVDGLTNDEVKSHLQKYRLHIRRVGSKDYSKKHAFPGSMVSLELYHDSSKQSNPHSDSPQGPLQLDGSPNGGESIEEEEEEDDEDDDDV